MLCARSWAGDNFSQTAEKNCSRRRILTNSNEERNEKWCHWAVVLSEGLLWLSAPNEIFRTQQQPEWAFALKGNSFATWWAREKYKHERDRRGKYYKNSCDVKKEGKQVISINWISFAVEFHLFSALVCVVVSSRPYKREPRLERRERNWK